MKCLGGLFIIPASSLTMGSPRLTGFAESFQAKVVSVSEPTSRRVLIFFSANIQFTLQAIEYYPQSRLCHQAILNIE